MKQESQAGEAFQFETLIGLDVASELVGVPYKTLVRQAAEGTFPAAKIGKRWKTRRSAIDEWFRERVNSRREKSASSHGKDNR